MKFISQIQKFVKDKSLLTWLAFVVLAVAITWATVNQINQNAKLERLSRHLSEEIELLEQQISIQELEQELLTTEERIRLEAADNLALVEPGSSLLILTKKEVDLLAEYYQQKPQAEVEQTTQLTNLEKWIRFFSGQQSL